jgi:hypothetical protein
MPSRIKFIFSGLLKALHQLWLEVSGAMLITFGAAFGLHALRVYRTSPANSFGWQFLSAVCLAFLTLVFGLHSFWKSRNLR